MVLLGELDELTLAHIVAKPKPLLVHARADLDKNAPLLSQISLVVSRSWFATMELGVDAMCAMHISLT